MTIHRPKKAIGLLLLVLILGSVSCIRNIEESIEELERVNRIKFNPELALPLINSDLSLADLVKRVNTDLIYEDDNQLLHAIYRGELLTIEAQDFVVIDDQVADLAIGFSQSEVDQVINNGSLKLNFSGTIDYNINNVEIDSMLTKICRSLMTLTSQLQHDVDVKVTFPDVQKAGQSLVLQASSNYSGSLPNTVSTSANLEGYMFDMTQTAKGYSQVKLQLEININKNGANPMSTSDSIRFKAGFYFNEFQVLWGDIGYKDISPNADTISLNIFNSSDNGSFTITDPRVKIFVYNSFGIPILARVNELGAHIPSQGGDVELTGIPDPLPIPVPTAAQMGQTLVDSVVMNNSNSNLSTLINNRPERFYYDFKAEINPAGQPHSRNFIMDTSQLRIGVDIDIPLDITAKDFGLEKEQEFEMEVETIDELEYAIIRLALNNSFPMEFAFQVIFLDSMGVAIDSLVNEEHLVIAGGEIDANGEIIAPGNTVHDFRIDQARLDNMSKAKKVLLKAKVTTPSYQGSQVPVKFYSYHKLGFKMGIQLKAKIDETL